MPVCRLQMSRRRVEGPSQAWLWEMINNPAKVSHKESLPVSPLTPEQPGVIMTCQHIWWERLTASPPNRASSGQRSPGRPPILFSSCPPSFSRRSAVILNSHITVDGGSLQSRWIFSTMYVPFLLFCIFYTCIVDIFDHGLSFQFLPP